MKILRPLLLLAVAGLGAVHGFAQGTAPEAPSPFDGRWAVHLVCDDARDASGKVVKGYAFDFPVQVRDGQLQGQRGESGQAAFLALSGRIAADGQAQVRAEGLTGQPDYVFGRTQPATPYRYTLRGRFDGAHGQLQRVELRHCEAAFERQG